MMERSFFHESRDLYRFRDYIINTWVDAMPPRPIIIADGELVPQPLPEMPENLNEALRAVNEQIAKLMAEHLALSLARRHFDSSSI